MDPVVPWSVIAITFTNKAAGELKERLGRMCGPAANDIWAATFHSACVRILRRDIERLDLGFTNNFTIYDSDDSRRVIKDILKDMSLDEKDFQPRSVLSIISNAKDEDQSPEEFSHRARSSHDWRMPRIAEIYAGYARRLREANALDFDDIILHAVHLLQKDEEVRTYYQRSSATSSSTSTRTPTTSNTSWPSSWRGAMRTSAWWATTTSPSTASGGPTSRTS